VFGGPVRYRLLILRSPTTNSNPLIPLAAGRALFGGIAVAGAVPLCRLAGITAEPARARRIGLALAVVDVASVVAALRASTVGGRRRVSNVNASSDLSIATALAVMAQRRNGRARMLNLAARSSVAGGGVAWAVMAHRLAPTSRAKAS